MKHGYSKRRMNQPIADWNTETAKKEIPQTVLSIETRAGQISYYQKTPIGQPPLYTWEEKS